MTGRSSRGDDGEWRSGTGGEDGSDPPVVVKVGGARAVDPAGAVADVAHLTATGRLVVVVHGGSTAVDDALHELGEEPEYVETPDGVVGRFTDERAMEVFEMVLPGKLNTGLVADLQAAGVNAVGLSGVDGRLLAGPRKSAVRVREGGREVVRRGDHSGRIERVNDGLLWTLLEAGYVPVVTVPMLADDGTPVNADADRAAAAVAAALSAALVVLTDVPGVLADPENRDSRIERAATPEQFVAVTEAAEGFMRRKVMAAREALSGGAASVTVADASVRDPVLAALDGRGTVLLPGAVEGKNTASSTEGSG